MIRLLSFLSLYLLVGCGSHIAMDSSYLLKNDAAVAEDGDISLTNTSPSLTAGSSINVIELTTNVISSSQLQVSDSEQASTSITYEVETLPSSGDLSLSGTPLTVGGTFTQDDIDNSRITYVHKYDLANDTTAEIDSFTFSYTDGLVDKVTGNSITLNIANFCDDKSAATSFSTYGDGSDATPYIICTLAQLNSIGLDNTSWSSSFKLKASIDMSSLTGTSYNVIGNQSVKFTGNFDGRNNTLSNFNYSDATGDYIGIFGSVNGAGKIIKSVKMTNVNITARDYVGSLIAWGYFTEVHNINIQGNLVCRNYCGGAIGTMQYSLASFLSADIDVNSTGDNVGGAIGYFGYGSIENAFSKGEVDGANVVGGIAGVARQSIVRNVFNSANITGLSVIGGVAADMWSGRIDNAFNTGSISGVSAGNDWVGFITGRIVGFVSNLYYDSTDTCLNGGPGGSCNTSGSPVAINTGSSPNYFFDKTNPPLSSWDFTNGWQDDPSNHPSFAPTELAGNWGTCSDHLSDTPFAGGVGTPLNPYIICSASQLNQVGLDNTYFDKHFVIKNNIDMSEISGSYNIIGSSANPFKGSFSGHGYTISNLTINESANDVGLIGHASEGFFQGIKLVSVDVTGLNNTGALIGNAYSPINIGFSSVTGSVSGQDLTGGLLGLMSRASIANSYNQATVSGQNYVGGLAGGTDLGEILITLSYNSGAITGQGGVGGLIGGLTGSNDFAYVFSAGAITGTTTHVGQLYGTDSASNLTSAYIDEDALCSGCVHTRGTNIDTGSNPNYFFTQTNAPLSAWSFNQIWQENTGAFPTLQN